jgi:lipopolysaccharide/colanic/teichoic acid biosynthesis glycosyltransferase
MSKQPSRISNPNQAGIWHLAGGRVVSFLIAAALIILCGFFALRAMNEELPLAQGVGGVIILAAGLCMALERSLAILSLSLKWRYRSAFLATLGVFLIFWFSNLIISLSSISFIWIIVAVLGAFLGSILVISFNEKLWENNSPPSEEVLSEVYHLHLDVIGIPGETPPLKRIFNFCLGLIGLLISLPIWLASTFLVWIEDPGPLLFVKNSVGKGGKNFHQYKLRTMVRGAEETTGPVLASEDDDRVLKIGRLLRKTALDELPQLLNILRGEMSFVGPRPQRTVLVLDYLKDMPEYAQRHQVLPGLAGLAQVAGDYYLTPRQKLRFDRLYIEYANLGFDLKLIALAFAIAFWFRWQKDWDGRLPRGWLRFGGQ